jgi:hypothetical protein
MPIKITVTPILQVNWEEIAALSRILGNELRRKQAAPSSKKPKHKI